MHHYYYDAENQLIQVDGTLGTCSSAAACYVYDAEGKRVQKTIGSSQTSYLYDLSGHVVAENYGAAWAVGYVYAGGQLIAQYKNDTTFFVHPDHLGSTRLMTSMNQSIYDSMDYLPFGEQIAGDTGATHKFTGKERDPESNLDNFGARYFGSALGRFMSVDPAFESELTTNPQSWNRYAYSYNRPLMLTDPDGRCPNCITAAIGAGAGGAVGGGISLVSQLISNGGHFDKVDWTNVEAHAAGGAVAGGLAGFTLGVSEAPFIIDLLVGGGSNVAGGMVERDIEGGDVTDGDQVAEDFVSGMAGGAIAHGVSNAVEVPNPGPRPLRGRNYRRRLGDFNKRVAARDNAINRGFGLGTALSLPVVDWMKGWMNRVNFWLAWNSPPPDPQPHITVQILPCTPGNGCKP